MERGELLFPVVLVAGKTTGPFDRAGIQHLFQAGRRFFVFEQVLLHDQLVVRVGNHQSVTLQHETVSGLGDLDVVDHF